MSCDFLYFWSLYIFLLQQKTRLLSRLLTPGPVPMDPGRNFCPAVVFISRDHEYGPCSCPKVQKVRFLNPGGAQKYGILVAAALQGHFFPPKKWLPS